MKKISIFLLLLLFVSSCKTESTPKPANNLSVHLKLGNPTNANTEPDNYLLIKPQYTLSYNKTKAHANWVSWELSKSYSGNADRQNDFRPDQSLPAVNHKVTTNDYTN